MNYDHLDCSIHIERQNMHCLGIACIISFYAGLTSAAGQKACMHVLNVKQMIFV
jgi:hypothetical protein